MDLKEHCSGSESPRSCISDNGFSEVCAAAGKRSGDVKRCVECQITTTPLWRGGPAGPKTLCNACGIKYHKKRRALLGINKAKVEKFKKKTNPNIIIKNTPTTKNNNNDNIALPLKIKLIKKSDNNNNNNSNNNNNNNNNNSDDDDNNLGEIERAALLLMALSYGSIYY